MRAWLCVAIAIGLASSSGCAGASTAATPSPSAALDCPTPAPPPSKVHARPIELSLGVSRRDRVGQEVVVVDGVTVHGRAYWVADLEARSYTIELRPASEELGFPCMRWGRRAREGGFGLGSAGGSCGFESWFSFTHAATFRFVVYEEWMDHPLGPPYNRCGDYVITVRPGRPSCAR